MRGSVVRSHGRSSAGARSRMSTETPFPTVFGVNEQADIDVDVARWVALARLVLADERVHERFGSDAELSLMFVDAQTIAELNERFLGATGPTDVLAFPLDEELPPGGRQPDQGGRGPGAPADAGDPPALLGDVVVCPAVASRQAAARRAVRRRARIAGRARRPASARLRPRRSRRCAHDAAPRTGAARAVPRYGVGFVSALSGARPPDTERFPARVDPARPA